MKTINILKRSLSFPLMASLLITSCTTNPNKSDESKEVAAEINEKKFDAKATEKDAQFIVDATSGSYDEISIADIALARSSNDGIKKMAQQLKDDHSAIITELNGLASQKAITVPAVASEAAGKAGVKLGDASVNAFDKDWLDKVEDMHESSIKTYENAGGNATDADIKAWAITTLTKIKAHLEMIHKAQDMKK